MKSSLRDRRVRGLLAAALVCGGLASTPSVRAQVKLEPKFPPGRVLKHKTTHKTHQILTLNGMPIETEATEVVVTDESAGQARADGTVPVTFKVDSLKVDLALPGGLNVNFDSADPDAKIEIPQLAFLGDVFRLTSRIGYTVVLDGENRPKAVEGTEAIRDQARQFGDTVSQSVASRISADKIKSQFEQSTAKLADILVRPGETWERTETMDLDSGQTITFRKKYEYLGTETRGDKTLDKIGVTATEVVYSQDPAVPTPLRATKSDLKIASSAGTILFDREGGYIVLESRKDHIKGGIAFTANGQEIAGVLDLKFDQETETLPAAK